MIRKHAKHKVKTSNHVHDNMLTLMCLIMKYSLEETHILITKLRNEILNKYIITQRHIQSKKNLHSVSCTPIKPCLVGLEFIAPLDTI